MEWKNGIYHTDFPDFTLGKYMWKGVRKMSEIMEKFKDGLVSDLITAQDAKLTLGESWSNQAPFNFKSLTKYSQF